MGSIKSTRDAQELLLESPDPQLAANKRLVWDMYRIVVIGGHADRAKEFIADDYVQHNPNVGSGLAALVAFLKGSRPERPIEDRITLPLLHVVAENDMVLVVNQRPETDAEGNDYMTTWFDLYRLENGLIVEHWDPALRSPDALRFDPNTKRVATVAE